MDLFASVLTDAQRDVVGDGRVVGLDGRPLEEEDVAADDDDDVDVDAVLDVLREEEEEQWPRGAEERTPRGRRDPGLRVWRRREAGLCPLLPWRRRETGRPEL